MGTMKGGKEDDKAMRPMFPRLHVSDRDKGGPRAPPRNKMALYEQLSIPSQRSSSTTLSPRETGTLLHSTSSSQASYLGGSHERTSYSPFCLPHSRPTPSPEKPYSQSSNGKHLKTMQFERSTSHVDYKSSRAAGSGVEGNSFNAHDFLSGKNSFKMKYDDDDDIRIPTFVRPTIAPHSKDASLVEADRPAPFGASSIQKSATLNSIIQLPGSGKPTHAANASGTILKADKQIHGEQESRKTVVCKEHGLEFPTDSEAREMLANPSENSLAAADKGAENNMRCLEKTGHDSASMAKESSHNVSVKGLRSLNDVGVLESRSASKMRSGSCFGAPFGNCYRNYDDKANGSGELKDAYRSCEVSEASMVDSISGLEISPDDVAGIIGPKLFWKARRAIVNQQRVFAIQVFELHRLIKVQRVFAASPHLLLDDSHIFKIQPKVATKILPVASSLKLQQVVQQRVDSFQKPRQNVYPLVEKAADLQTQESGPNKEVDQLPRYLPHSGNPPPIPMAPDRPNPWFFQPAANQWLIPVMSPSEGLIYKPYSGPNPPTAGIMAPLYESCGPLSLPSVRGDVINTAYAVPASHQLQNMGFLPDSPAIAPNFFPSPYGMLATSQVISASAVEQVRPLTSAKLNGRSVQHSWSLCNRSITRSEASSGCAQKLDASKGSELQGSTASSPCDTALREGRDVLALFPSASAAERSCQPSQSSCRDHQTNVIKVVPHNRRSATESAARIFRSIQKERQQLDW